MEQAGRGAVAFKVAEQSDNPLHGLACDFDLAVPQSPMNAVHRLQDLWARAAFDQGHVQSDFGRDLCDLHPASQMRPVQQGRAETGHLEMASEHLVAVGETGDPRMDPLTQDLKRTLDDPMRFVDERNHRADLDRSFEPIPISTS